MIGKEEFLWDAKILVHSLGFPVWSLDKVAARSTLYVKIAFAAGLGWNKLPLSCLNLTEICKKGLFSNGHHYPFELDPSSHCISTEHLLQALLCFFLLWTLVKTCTVDPTDLYVQQWLQHLLGTLILRAKKPCQCWPWYLLLFPLHRTHERISMATQEMGKAGKTAKMHRSWVSAKPTARYGSSTCNKWVTQNGSNVINSAKKKHKASNYAIVDQLPIA